MRGAMGILTMLSSYVPALAPILTVVLLAGGIAYYASGGNPVVIGIATGAALVVMLVITIIRAILKRKRTKSFESNLKAQRSAIKAQAKENLQDVRSKFLETLDVLRGNESGKDYLYTVPWYVIFGEPASGKTTTIKTLASTGIRFLGTGDKMRGIGGTANCDWWFSDHAVILDTAGRWAIPEEMAPDKVEWEGFLDMLFKFRPRQPINGAIVVVPTDRLCPRDGVPEAALIADAKEKGEQLRDRLDKLQNHLKVSFPVYVLITKADHIEGFEDFFVSLPAAYQTTLFGWSNPHDIEERYSSQWVDEAYASVEKDLERARYLVFSMESMSFDAAPRVFLFPKKFQKTKTTLQVYLEAMFSRLSYEKNVYLRGIYFTSGHQEREGSKTFFKTQSQTLADSGAMHFDWAPRPYFIHDFYREKVFRERGLVRPHARELRRRLAIRRIAMIVAIVVAFLGLAWTALLAYQKGSAASEAEQSIADLRRETPKSDDNTFFVTNQGMASWNIYLNAVERLPEKVGKLLDIGNKGDSELQRNLGSIVERVLSRAVIQPVIDHVALTFPYHKGYLAPAKEATSALRLPAYPCDQATFDSWRRELTSQQWTELLAARPKPARTEGNGAPQPTTLLLAKALSSYAAEQHRVVERLLGDSQAADETASPPGTWTRWSPSETDDLKSLLPDVAKPIGDKLNAVLIQGGSPRDLSVIEGSIRLYRRYPRAAPSDVRTDLLIGELTWLFDEECRSAFSAAEQLAAQWTQAHDTFVKNRNFDTLSKWQETKIPTPPNVSGMFEDYWSLVKGARYADAAKTRLKTVQETWAQKWNEALSRLQLYDPASPDEPRALGHEGTLDALALAQWQEAGTLFEALDPAIPNWSAPSTLFETVAEAHAYFARPQWETGKPPLVILDHMSQLGAPVTGGSSGPGLLSLPVLPEAPDDATRPAVEAKRVVRLVLIEKLCQRLGADLVGSNPNGQLDEELYALFSNAPGDAAPDLEVILARANVLTQLAEQVAPLTESTRDHYQSTLAFLRSLPGDEAPPSAVALRGFLESCLLSHLESVSIAVRGTLTLDVADANLPTEDLRTRWNPRSQLVTGKGGRLAGVTSRFCTRTTRGFVDLVPVDPTRSFLVQWLAEASEEAGQAELRTIPNAIETKVRNGFRTQLASKPIDARPREFYATRDAAKQTATPTVTKPHLAADERALQMAVQTWYFERIVTWLATSFRQEMTSFAAATRRPFRLTPDAREALDFKGVQEAFATWSELRDRWSLTAEDPTKAFSLPEWMDGEFQVHPDGSNTAPSAFAFETNRAFEAMYPILFGKGKSVDWTGASWEQEEGLAAIRLRAAADYPSGKATLTLEVKIAGDVVLTQPWAGFQYEELTPISRQHLPTQILTKWDPRGSLRIDTRESALVVDPETGALLPDPTAKVELRAGAQLVTVAPREPRAWYVLEWLERHRDEAEGDHFLYTVPFQGSASEPLQVPVLRDMNGENPQLLHGKLLVQWDHSLDAIFGETKEDRTARSRLRDPNDLAPLKTR